MTLHLDREFLNLYLDDKLKKEEQKKKNAFIEFLS